ncbi:glycosyltransferase family 1 protein [Chloroflexia bacterium SDU3-3]|nr:glycosyltransferase family 1 protein [Chloroflexia bacterium SDU3-3]
MDITLLSYGSRGDVQPYVALALALHQAGGHHIRLVAPPDFAALAQDYPLNFFPVGVNVQEHLKERSRVLAQSGKSIRNLRVLRNELRSIMDDVARDTWEACQGSELIIGVGPASYSVAEKLGVPFIEVAMQPVTPTRAFPSPVVPPWLQGGGTINRLTHVLFEQFFWQLFRASTNRQRTQVLGLPPFAMRNPVRHLREHGLLRLYAYSPHVVPRPDDWPAHHHVTGYWFLPPPAGWQPPPELAAFLDAGPPPVYIGFGSMLGKDPKKTTALVTEALARSGQRGVLAGGWGALGEGAQPTAHLFLVDSIPHHWLFPHMAAIVHHGGAGTTGAALRGGVPSIVVPFSFDQPFWGQRVASLGVGPQPIPRAKLTVRNLADAIEQAVHDAQMRERAAQLGARIQAENGTAQAIALIDQAIHR